MNELSAEKAAQKIYASEQPTFLTGAGVSTPSGVPDYRSLKGVYQGIEAPEYLLSVEAMDHEPEKFYSFIKKLYHPEARPNVIHQVLAELEQTKNSWVVSQNIDDLHAVAGSKKRVDFHGTLYDCYCRKCHQRVSWKDYLISDRHTVCGGQIRPAIVLYGEGFTEETLIRATEAVASADLVVIVGTSFQVHPFCDLINYRNAHAEILVINQTPIHLSEVHLFAYTNGIEVFKKLKE